MNHFFDVGAHDGNTFQHLGAEYNGWNIWCFEPSPRHLPDLVIRSRHLSERFNITICPFGLGGKNELLEFYLKTDPQGDSFAYDFVTNLERIGCKFMVGIHDISEFILTNTSSEDTIHVKLDCETSEYAILNSLLNNNEAFNRVKKLMVEFHCKNNVSNEEYQRENNELISKCEEMGHTVLPWNH